MAPGLSVGEKKHSGTARVLGSGTSGIAELLIFHPVDTVAKRLMSNKQSALTVSQIVFKDKASAPIGTKFFSLFPGLGYAAGYKVLQRVYKFGGQPFVNDYLVSNHKAAFTSTFGEKNGKSIMQATAGSIIGVGEVVLLPLDVLKIKRQTNPEAFRSRGFVRIVLDEGTGLYRGAGTTAMRNAPGSFALFGGSAFAHQALGSTPGSKDTTWTQNFIASIAGSVSSITVAAPLDVVKTRIQQANFEKPVGGLTVIKDLLKNEGASALFKGLVPKILVVGPKLIFSFTLAQSLIPMYAKLID